MKIIAISLLSWVAVAANDFLPGRVVGGYEVTPEFKYPWIVSLQFYGRHSCGGTLYNRNSIISAAHCVIGKIDNWTASIHRHNLTKTDDEERGDTYKVEDRIINKFYSKDNGNINDIAIWKISGGRRLRDTVELDDGKISYSEGRLLSVIGWGRTTLNGKTSPVLRQLELPIYSSDECSKVFTTFRPKLQFCAGFPEGKKDSCRGDSGGPIFETKRGITTLVGIVSWGRGCAFPGHPGIYTRVSQYLDFIKDNV